MARPPAKKERMSGGPAPCYAFQEGNCDRGDGCRFAHGDGGGGGGGGRGGGEGGRGGGKGKGGKAKGGKGKGGKGDSGKGKGGGGSCFAFQKGICDRGDGCRFAHV